MRTRLFPAGLLMISTLLSAQPGRPGSPSDRQTKTEQYKLSGNRHGISFFPTVKHQDVQYVFTDTLGFDRYHSLDVIDTWLRKWAKEFPELVDLYEVGKSFESRPIMQMTLTNKKTGKDSDKPAAFFEGGRHSGEVTSSECVVWMAHYLLMNY